jgi:leader peptidase (prepilin peptidase)/N-methyltransferase
MDALSAIIVLCLGLCFGSFATALVYRLPRGISMVRKVRSSCVSCKNDLGFFDLVPVFSYLFLRGKCRYCRAPIGKKYLAIEMETVALCLLFGFVYGLSPESLPLLCLAPVLISIIAIDLEHKIIPDVLNAAVLLLGIFNPFLSLTEGIMGAILYSVAAFALRQGMMWWLKREPMGLGDIKFFAAAGMWLGIDPEIASLFMFFSGISGVFLALVWKKMKGEAEFPFGPALVISFTAIVLTYDTWRDGIL